MLLLKLVKNKLKRKRKLNYCFSIVLFTVLICSCSTPKESRNILLDQSQKKIRYFNEKNIEISEMEFSKIRSTNLFLDIPGDSSNHKKLIDREFRGTITNKSNLVSLLENELNQKIDGTKPIVIIYHPGNDPCNSSGSVDRRWIKNWFKQLEVELYQIAQIKPIYIYKNSDGLDKYKGIIEWYKDPENTIEHLFFKHHYPCSSFVVISKNGDFISYFGEFMKEFVWKATEIMNK